MSIFRFRGLEKSRLIAARTHCGISARATARIGSRTYSSTRNGSRPCTQPRWLVGSLAGAALVSILLLKDPVLSDSPQTGITVEEVEKHTSVETGVWVVINGNVYDLSQFLERHPGGASIILKYAGKNASAIFNKFHASNFIQKYLEPHECLGPLIGEMEPAPDVTQVGDEEIRQQYLNNLPPLNEVLRLSDFEAIAKKILPPTAWCYYSSGADDEITMRENHNAFSRIFFKPRVLVDVSEVDISTTMLGHQTAAPFYCSAAAQAKLGHPDGELSIARGCTSSGIVQMISNYASFPLADIVKAAQENSAQWFQLYWRGEESGREAVDECHDLGLKAIFVTVDTPELGRREKDMKLRAEIERQMDDGGEDDNYAQLKSSVVYGRDLSVTWKEIADITSWTQLPVAVKGVQSVEDVVLAAEKGVKAVVLSNHGGRQLDYSRAPVEVLADAMPVLREKGLADKIEVYIDGGVRRGSDVVKCLALGAKGVGLGRVFLYANSAYGEEGVQKAIELLKAEIVLNMKLLGVTKLDQLGPQHLDMRNLHARNPPPDYVFVNNYEPLTPPAFGNESQ